MDNVAFIGSLYEAHGRGDFETLFSHCDPAIAWVSHGDPTLPWCRRHHGIAGMQAYFAALHAELAIDSFTIAALLPMGDRVHAHGSLTARMKTRGDAPFATNWAQIFTVRDGRLIEFQEFFDAESAARLLRQAPPLAPASSPASHAAT